MSEATVTTTTLGTPISSRWDTDWIAEVERVEGELGRRICGAHAPNWRPCKLGPDHENGRCRFHGGHAKIGAPKGNVNAVTHGLYMRRLQQCGTQCPLWHMCPLAGPDVLALEPRERPYCAYESEEYVQTLKTLTSSLAKEEVNKKKADEDPFIASVSATADPDAPLPQGEGERPREPWLDPKMARSSSGATAPVDDTPPTATTHTSTSIAPFTQSVSFGGTFSFPKEKVPVFHNIALYQTMFSRATAAVRVIGLTDEYVSEGEHFRASSSRVGAILNAQLRIARELRQWIRLAANDAMQDLFGLRSDDTDASEDAEGPRSLPDIAKEILAKTEGVLDECLVPVEDDQAHTMPGPYRPGEAGPFGGTGPAPA